MVTVPTEWEKVLVHGAKVQIELLFLLPLELFLVLEEGLQSVFLLARVQRLEPLVQSQFLQVGRPRLRTSTSEEHALQHQEHCSVPQPLFAFFQCSQMVLP